MSDRLVRDELLHSERFLSLRRNTHRLAFVTVLLRADSLGNFEANEASLWRFWRDVLALTERPQVAEILNALADADLVRLYEASGKRYAHIPRYRQRMRYYKRAHPRPPSSIEDKEIKELLEKRQVQDGSEPDSHLSRTAERSERSEVKEVKPLTSVLALVDPPSLTLEGYGEPLTNARTPGKRKEAKQLRGSRMDPEMKFPDEWRDWMVSGFDVTPQRALSVFLEFRGYWCDLPGERGLKVRWFPTFKNRVIELHEKGKL